MSDNAETTGQARGRATRADILGVARRAFSERGYHSTGIADIQEVTGLTKGAFYHHFRSKEDLALAVLERARGDYTEHLFGPVMEHDGPLRRIEALLDTAVALNDRPEWCNCQMLTTLAAELTPTDGRLHGEVQSMQMEMLDFLSDCLTQAREADEIPRDLDPDGVAQWITSTITGILLARKLGTERVPASQLVAMIKRTVLAKPTDDANSE